MYESDDTDYDKTDLLKCYLGMELEQAQLGNRIRNVRPAVSCEGSAKMAPERSVSWPHPE